MRIEKSASTVFTPLADETAVLLNLDTRIYYNLNRTASILWQQIEDDKVVTLENLVHKTCERFDVDEQTARSTLTEFLGRLGEFKMIRIG